MWYLLKACVEPILFKCYFYDNYITLTHFSYYSVDTLTDYVVSLVGEVLFIQCWTWTYKCLGSIFLDTFFTITVPTYIYVSYQPSHLRPTFNYKYVLHPLSCAYMQHSPIPTSFLKREGEIYTSIFAAHIYYLKVALW